MPNFPPVVFGATTSSSELLSFSLSLSLELPPAQNLAFAAAISALLCLSGDCDSHTIRGRPSNFIFSFERLKKREGMMEAAGCGREGQGPAGGPRAGAPARGSSSLAGCPVQDQKTVAGCPVNGEVCGIQWQTHPLSSTPWNRLQNNTTPKPMI
jgi:hypothetical protein